MRTLKTYIIEDSSVVLNNLAAVLSDLVPITVVGTADDEPTAVQSLTRLGSEVDLVIVDIFLKAGSGLGVLRALQDSPSCPQIVVLTNFATPEVNRKCLELGANAVFDKSNELGELISHCCRLAEGETPSLPPTIVGDAAAGLHAAQ